MKKLRYIACCLAATLAIGAMPMPSNPFPEAEISNGIVRARLYLPDAEKGYYRGSRFDWSAVMPELEVNGHTWGGQWFQQYSPTLHDAIMGPVESFSPVGYDEAGPGGRFVGIGIGVMTRPDTAKYTPFKYYEVVNPGEWKIKKKNDAIVFRQRLEDPAGSYDYEKTVRLVKGRPELALEHTLKNTAKRVIETDVYNHNLFVVDHQPIGPGYLIRFPFSLTAEGARGFGEIAAINGDSIAFNRGVAARESVYTVLHGYSGEAKDYDIRLENHTTGAAVRITCDRPLSKMVFWSCATTACPEPYIHVKINPGETFTWTIRYSFYSCEIRK